MVGFHTKLYIMLKASAAVNESFLILRIVIPEKVQAVYIST